MLNFLMGVMRVLIGFFLACLTAGAVSIFLSITLEDLDKLSVLSFENTSFWVLYNAYVIAVFSSPLAILTLIFCEWRGVNNILYYITIGIAISIFGLLVIMWNEISAELSLSNIYGFFSFFVTGFISGAAYWLFSGQFAHRSRKAMNTDSDALDIPKLRKLLRPASTAHAQLPLKKND